MRLLPLLAALSLAGCGPDYSPNVYAGAAVQQAAKVDQGVVVGVRTVAVAASGSTGAVAGGAAGAAVGSQVPAASSLGSALGAVGGSLLGGLVGATAERAAGDTEAYEYIVRKPDGALISVTQKDPAPLALGTRVLVIAGAQARIVPDYTVPLDPPAPSRPPEPRPPEPRPPEPRPPEPGPPGPPAPATTPPPALSEPPAEET